MNRQIIYEVRNAENGACEDEKQYRRNKRDSWREMEYQKKGCRPITSAPEGKLELASGVAET
jgi:hypothetical protein